MVLAAMSVMEEFTEIFISYGQSDEFSFVFERNAEVFNRRSEKILSCLVSRFSSAYTFYWKSIFGLTELKFPPCFDARIILYPSYSNIRDYFSWRQADCHINNLYNTCFWALVDGGQYNKQQANQLLKPTFSADKHEILFKKFNINYNNIPSVYRKGTTIFRKIEKKYKKSIKNKKIDIKNQKENIADKEEIEKEIIEESNTDQNFKFDNLTILTIVKEEDSKLKNNNILLNDKNFIEIYEKYYNKLIITDEDIIKSDFWNNNKFKETDL